MGLGSYSFLDPHLKTQALDFAFAIFRAEVAGWWMVLRLVGARVFGEH